VNVWGVNFIFSQLDSQWRQYTGSMIAALHRASSIARKSGKQKALTVYHLETGA
jgi:hypothetical protein